MEKTKFTIVNADGGAVLWHIFTDIEHLKRYVRARVDDDCIAETILAFWEKSPNGYRRQWGKRLYIFEPTDACEYCDGGQLIPDEGCLICRAVPADPRPPLCTMPLMNAVDDVLRNVMGHMAHWLERHVQYDSYKGDRTWRLCHITRNVRTKGGLRFKKGDVTIGRPSWHEDQPKPSVTCWSWRTGTHVGIFPSEVAWIESPREWVDVGAMRDEIISLFTASMTSMEEQSTKLMRAFLEQQIQELKEDGGCDHSVGICACGAISSLLRLLDKLYACGALSDTDCERMRKDLGVAQDFTRPTFTRKAGV